MAEYAFYPGCNLHYPGQEYSLSLRLVAEKLEIGLTEIPDWNCCGGPAANIIDDQLTVDLAARNLVLAGEMVRDVVTPCGLCHERLNKARGQMAEAPGLPKVHNILEILTTEEILEKIRRMAKKSLSGLKVAPYYGCIFTRAYGSSFANSENPMNLDWLIHALGGEAVPWPFKTECCGGSLNYSSPEISGKLVGRLSDMAQQCGADCIMTVCPSCQANLDKWQGNRPDRQELPIFYISELIGLVLGFKPRALGLTKHQASVDSALANVGIYLNG